MSVRERSEMWRKRMMGIARYRRLVYGAALISSISTILPNAALADPTPAQKALAEQANYWEARHRNDRAETAWLKLLETDAENAEALLHLGLIEARAGHTDTARTYADRLRIAHPNAPQLAVLDRAIAVGALNPNLIDEARKLAKAGKFDAAVASYRRALNNNPPPPDLAQEYYETLAGTATGWDEARQGLKDMMAAVPNDRAIAVAYARVLTYHENTRREGIAMLSQLSGDPAVAREATQAWHDSLLWLGATNADIPLYKAYLALHPNDDAIVKRLAAVENPTLSLTSAKDLAHKRAFDELNAGHLSAAADLFEQLLKVNADDVDALGGLGVVRERQNNYRAAHDLLTRAVALSPKGDTRWTTALASATYWLAVEEAKAALRGRNYKLAEMRAREAAVHPFGGDATGQLLVGQVMQATRRSREAEKIYRDVLREKPGNREATALLVQLLIETGRAEEARRYAAQLPRGTEQIGRAEADALAAAARKQLASGDVPGALAEYRAAIAKTPDNAWLRLDYARLLERNGDLGAADREITAMVSVQNPSSDALQAASIWYGEHNRYADAMRYAERVPSGKRSAAFPGLERQWRAERDAQQAVLLAHQGRALEAHRLVDGIAQSAQGNIAVIGVAANAYVDIGDRNAALNLLRSSMTEHPSVDATLQYANILVRIDALDELGAVINGLDQKTGLTAAQQASLGDLKRTMAIKAADDARMRGDYAGAYDRLAPELARSHDPTLLSALARIYQSAGRNAEALQIYVRILQIDPTNVDVRREVISIAIANRDYDQARQLLRDGFARNPRDPRLHLMAAQLARAEGDDDAALVELGRAEQELARENGTVWTYPTGAYTTGTVAISSNPFRSGPAVPTGYSAYNTDNSPYGLNPWDNNVDLSASVPVSGPNAELANQIANQIEETKDNSRPSIQGGLALREIQGESGLSEMTQVSIPITGSAKVGPGRLTVTVEPTSVSSGTLNNTDPTVFRRFGTNASLPTGSTAPSYSGNATGVGLNLGYELSGLGLSADFGTTPEGFPTTQMIGHLVWAIPLGTQMNLKLTALREPMMDSLFSYAGVKDPLTGRALGGVAKTGGRVDVGYDNGIAGVYANGTYAFFEGGQSAPNSEIDASVGGYWRFYKNQNGALKVGVNIGGQAFDKNLRYFTQGQGGYFSPQSAFEATIPVEYTNKWGKLTYTLGAQVGLMTFHENSSPYFPTDPLLQDLAATTGPAIYPGQTVTTALYGVSAKAEYEIAPLLVVGGRVAADNAHNYNEQSLLLYIRKKFDTN